MNTKKRLSNFILLALEKSVDGYIRFDHFANNLSLYAYYDGWNFPIKQASLSQALRRLRENGFVELIDDSELVFRLTDSGRDKAMAAILKENQQEWDGKWRVIIFDIPEKRRVARDLLRQKLKEWGFTRLQNSVWISKKNCTKELRNFIKGVGISDWVIVMETTDLDI